MVSYYLGAHILANREGTMYTCLRSPEIKSKSWKSPTAAPLIKLQNLGRSAERPTFALWRSLPFRHIFLQIPHFFYPPPSPDVFSFFLIFFWFLIFVRVCFDGSR